MTKSGPSKSNSGDSPDTSDEIIVPSPDPVTNKVFADTVLRGAGLIARQGLERAFLGKRYAPDKLRKILKDRPIAESLVSSAVTKLATKSVPGAIVVAGGLLAKTLYDRRRNKKAEHDDAQEP